MSLREEAVIYDQRHLIIRGPAADIQHQQG